MRPQHLIFLGLGELILFQRFIQAPAGALPHAEHAYIIGKGGTYDALGSSNYLLALNTQPGGPWLVIFFVLSLLGLLLGAFWIWITTDKDPDSML